MKAVDIIAEAIENKTKCNPEDARRIAQNVVDQQVIGSINEGRPD